MKSTQDLSSTSSTIMASDDSFEDDTFECPKDIVDDVLLESPMIGMSFPTVDVMFNYYKHYGKQRGFSITRQTVNKDINGVLRGLTFTCSRYGKLLSKSKGVRKHCVHSKNECKARLRAYVVEGDRWEITMFVDEHNHALSPSKSRYFRCNREISAHVRRQLEINDIVGIRPNKSHNAQVIEAGGHKNLCFLEKDTRNHLAEVRRMRLGEGDANAIHSYFLKMQSLNEGFFSMIDWNDNGRLKNVFWADPQSRATCREFGDVISFDTTYLINKYDMPFAPFVGVNHHGQSILLGCGLISNKYTKTFIWLFRTWLACMFGVAPSGIITDQDKAMKNAIAVVFPGTRHRLCLWHILKKVSEKLGSYTLYDDIAGALGNVIYDSQSIDDFESGWKNMIQNFKK